MQAQNHSATALRPRPHQRDWKMPKHDDTPPSEQATVQSLPMCKETAAFFFSLIVECPNLAQLGIIGAGGFYAAPFVRTNSATTAPISSGLSSWMRWVPRTVVSVRLGQVRMGRLPEVASGPSRPRPRPRPDFDAAKRRPCRRRRSGLPLDTPLTRTLCAFSREPFPALARNFFVSLQHSIAGRRYV
jgi:hypothetical protein